MAVLFGLGILVILGGFAAFMYGAGTDRSDRFVYGSLLVAGSPVGLLVLGFALYLILVGFPPGNPMVEGACYRAVRHTTTTFIPVGKVLVPSTTSGIDLEEIRCP